MKAYLESASLRFMTTTTNKSTFIDCQTTKGDIDEKGQKRPKHMMMNYLKQLGGLGTIYERMQNNLRNIEHCLSFYVDRASTGKYQAYDTLS